MKSLCLLLVLSAWLSAADVPALRAGASPLFGIAEAKAWVTGNGFADKTRSGHPASVETLSVEGQPFHAAVKVEISTKPENPWNVQVRRTNAAALAVGTTGQVRFWIRSPSDKPRVYVVVGKSAAPYTKVAEVTPAVTGTWSLVDLPFTVGEEMAVGALSLSIHLGVATQTIEIGGLEGWTWPAKP